MSMLSGWPTSPIGGGRLPIELDLPTEAAPPAAAPEGIDDTVAYVDRGMPIPDAYHVDVVRALVQDPFHLLVYWELRPESMAALAAIFPDSVAADFHPSMRLIDLEEGFEAFVAIGFAGKYWFGAQPNRAYRVDVGARSAEHGFVPIIRSHVVRTPRGTIAPQVDDDPRYAVDTPRFVKLLAATGFATDRVLAEVASADAEREAGVLEPRAGTGVPAYLADAFARLPREVRAVASDVARGQGVTDEMLASLPERLRAILLGARREDGESEVLTAAFMHLLPQLMRQSLEGALVGGDQHPLHLPPRFAVGSSEVVRRPRVDWGWMPSMARALAGPPELAPDALDAV